MIWRAIPMLLTLLAGLLLPDTSTAQARLTITPDPAVYNVFAAAAATWTAAGVPVTVGPGGLPIVVVWWEPGGNLACHGDGVNCPAGAIYVDGYDLDTFGVAAAAHELGHALGLGYHRSDQLSCMSSPILPTTPAGPDAHDLAALGVAVAGVATAMEDAVAVVSERAVTALPSTGTGGHTMTTSVDVVKTFPFSRHRYPDPSPTNLSDPLFIAVWQAVKGWDIERVPGEGYAHATGSDVMHILNAIRALPSTETGEAVMSDLDRIQRMVGEWVEAASPTSEPEDIAMHLMNAAEELSGAVYRDADGRGRYEERAADCAVLLLRLAHRLEFSLHDAIAVVSSQAVTALPNTGTGGCAVSEVAVGTVIDANDEFGVVGLIVKGHGRMKQQTPAHYRVIRWCDGEPGAMFGASEPAWFNDPDALVGRGFWAVPLDDTGQECGPMRFFSR